MNNLHFPGHQQALIKNNICVQVLSFLNHDQEYFIEVFKNFDYDKIIDLCLYKNFATIGSLWNGTNFVEKPYMSWQINNNLEWEAPMPSPGDEFNWDEQKHEWIKINNKASE